MHLIQPFAGLRPTPAYAAAVAAPPYDVLSTDEARVRAAGKPWSFLHISKPEIDLSPSIDPHSLQVYAKAAENLERMLREWRDKGMADILEATWDDIAALAAAGARRALVEVVRISASTRTSVSAPLDPRVVFVDFSPPSESLEGWSRATTDLLSALL